LDGQVQRPERHGSKLEIKGTKHSLPVYAMQANKKYSHQDYYLIKRGIAQKQ
jgi:hypothetical protein